MSTRRTVIIKLEKRRKIENKKYIWYISCADASVTSILYYINMYLMCRRRCDDPLICGMCIRLRPSNTITFKHSGQYSTVIPRLQVLRDFCMRIPTKSKKLYEPQRKMGDSHSTDGASILKLQSPVEHLFIHFPYVMMEK